MIEAGTRERARVAEAEAQRCAAMEAGDLEALRDLLDPDLRYGHTSGVWDTRSGYLAKLADGRLEYHSARSRVDGHVVAGSANLLWVEVTAEVSTPAGRRLMRNCCLTVWLPHDGRYRMVAHQPTVLTAER
ncbi:nuclear transport factor 2 family protein [Pseudonocardia xishanensis]|uniref:DUF4440 domain-containing protein n=1 Tax=Pseudonocardia xishanensis TaxID=630995 RepID=A0ABP8S284_9PSEU